MTSDHDEALTVARQQRREQGLPARVTDPAARSKVAALLTQPISGYSDAGAATPASVAR